MTGAPASNASPGAVFRALSASTLEAAAPALGLTPAAAILTLKTANIDAAAGETLNQISARAGMNGAGVASLLVTRQRRS